MFSIALSIIKEGQMSKLDSQSEGDGNVRPSFVLISQPHRPFSDHCVT